MEESPLLPRLPSGWLARSELGTRTTKLIDLFDSLERVVIEFYLTSSSPHFPIDGHRKRPLATIPIGKLNGEVLFRRLLELVFIGLLIRLFQDYFGFSPSWNGFR